MNERYRAVVIGCGKIGATFEIDSGLVKPASHAAAIKANPRTELVGLVDPDEQALKRATDYYGVAGFKDPGAALSETKPDIVVVSTPPGTHEEYLALAIKHGVKAVICEKPVSDTEESAQRMIDMARASGIICIVNHQRRFFPLFKEVRELVASGALGRVQQVSTYYSNGLFNNGTHTIDAVQFLLDEKPVWAMGTENPLNTTAPFGSNIDGLVGFSKGAVATLQSLDNAEYGAHDFVLYGTRGAVTIRGYGYRLERLEVRDGVTFEGVRELDWDRPHVREDKRSMLEGTLVHALECLDGKASSGSTLEDAYATMQALEALAKSAKEGGVKVTI